MHKSVDLLVCARDLFPGKPFRMLTDMGPLIVLPPQLGNEIRNSPEVSFAETLQQVCVPSVSTYRFRSRAEK